MKPNIEKMTAALVSEGWRLSLTRDEVEKLLGIAKSTVYRRISAGLLPKPENGRFKLFDLLSHIHGGETESIEAEGQQLMDGERHHPDWVESEREKIL